jgi:hypothetical protein
MRNTERASYARYLWNDNDFPSFWRAADVNPLVSAVGKIVTEWKRTGAITGPARPTQLIPINSRHLAEESDQDRHVRKVHGQQDGSAGGGNPFVSVGQGGQQDHQ